MSILNMMPPSVRKDILGTVRPFRAWWPIHDLNEGRELIKAGNALDVMETGVVLVKEELRIDAGTDEELFRYINSVDAMEAGFIAVFEKDQ